ncbi:MAG TPA: nucleoside-diphosphate kinase [Candidatus Dormibacteraeota bacterium]|nr:nucleoside-diphosphate kinase [Candidatus Dormibacteraeota bacterium]
MADALLIFKPDAAHRIAVRAGIWAWLSTEREWKLESLAWFKAPADLIEQHYDFLQGRPFFPWLVDFMTALPLLVGRVSATPEAVEHMRYDLGETRIAQSRPGSLRERFGIFGGINCVHLSDAPATGATEVKRWSGFLSLEGIDVELDAEYDRPDHTYHLRSLATQVAGGQHVELASEAIRTLLAEETELEDADLGALYRIILGALA